MYDGRTMMEFLGLTDVNVEWFDSSKSVDRSSTGMTGVSRLVVVNVLQ